MSRTCSVVRVLMKVGGATAGTAIAITRITTTMASPTPDPPPAAGALARVVAGAEAGAVAGGRVINSTPKQEAKKKKENKRKKHLPGQECNEDVQNPVQLQLRSLRGPLSPFESLDFSAVVGFPAGPSPPWSEPMLP